VTARVEPRRVVLENVFNLRDLGGYRSADGRQVVDGQLFRADGLNRLSESDAAVVKELGIRTVVDLRTLYEREEWGSAPTDLLDATGVHLPIISELWPVYEDNDDHDPVAYLIERYHEMTVEGAASLATLLGIVADDVDAVPLVFHCSAGKDRTGVTAALILGLVTGLSQGLGKLALDAIIQRDVPEVVRTSVFARSETLLQLSWVIGGFLGVFMPLNAKLGLSVVAVVLVAWSVFVLHGRLASARTQRRVS